MDVSKNIRTIRESKNLTQVDVSVKLGTERSNYARLESRGENLTIKQVGEIASALEVSIYDIIGLPEAGNLKDVQSAKIGALEEKLRATEEILKDKRKNIKLYKSFIEWTKNKYRSQFIISALTTADRLDFCKIDPADYDEDHDLTIEEFGFTDDQLREIGESMLDIEAPDYFLNNFVASSGFVTDSWFIDAFKRVSRRRKEKIAHAEVKNWVSHVFEFLEEE